MPRKRPYPWIAPGNPLEGFERSEPSQRVNTSICILPEGENEASYFKGLTVELRAPSVVIDNVRGVPKTLIERALEVQEANQRAVNRGEPPDYDQIWCVSDGGDDHPGVPEALAHQAREAGIRTAVSMPCFEVWQLLLLQELTARPIESADAAKRLMRENHLPGFGKTSSIVPYSMLEGKFREAARRARELKKHHQGHGGEPNPSSDVFLLVGEIVKVGSLRRFARRR